jgi:hypothetical protein
VPRAPGRTGGRQPEQIPAVPLRDPVRPGDRGGAFAWALAPGVYDPWAPPPADPDLVWNAKHQELFQQERQHQVSLLRCLLGNPFRPVVPDPAWQTRTVVAVAKAIYHEHLFEDLPVLADALEEAGCRNEQVLEHCRGGGPTRAGALSWTGSLAIVKPGAAFRGVKPLRKHSEIDLIASL